MGITYTAGLGLPQVTVSFTPWVDEYNLAWQDLETALQGPGLALVTIGDDKLIKADPDGTTLELSDATAAAKLQVKSGVFIPHSLATAANDFLVASGVGAYVKKTLAETQVILNALLLSGGTLSGSLGINLGAETPATKLHLAETITTSPRGLMSSQHNAGTDGARLHLRKSRGTLASPAIVVTGDNLGRLVASGYDGAAYQEMAGIILGTQGTIAAGRIPTYLAFLTATDASPSVLTERMRISAAGYVGIGIDTPTARLHVVDASYPVMDIIRSTVVTTTNVGVARLLHQTTGDMADGFGASLIFEATDSGAANKVLGQIGGIRDTADTEGALVFKCGTGGLEEFMRINKDGNVGLNQNSPNAAALLHLTSTTRGFLPPVMTAAQMNAISTPPEGLMVYNSDMHKPYFRTAAAWQTSGYQLQALGDILSPVDATTYYFGQSPSGSMQTTSGISRIYINKPGVITACTIFVYSAGSPTAETSSVYLRLNNTTDTLISNAVRNDGSALVLTNYALNIAVVQGDYIEIKWVTPTWVTDPAAVTISAITQID